MQLHKITHNLKLRQMSYIICLYYINHTALFKMLIKFLSRQNKFHILTEVRIEGFFPSWKSISQDFYLDVSIFTSWKLVLISADP